MRLLIGSMLGLLLLSSPVFGQLTEIRVDNSSMPGEDVAEVLVDEGFTTLEEVAYVPLEEMMGIAISPVPFREAVIRS